jgi:uncharacterized cupin superfamily protein
MSQNDQAIVVARSTGSRVGNVEFLSLSEHSPRFNVSIITLAPGRHGPEAHIHDDEDDAFYVLDGDLQFVIDEQEGPRASGDPRAGPARRHAHLHEPILPSGSDAQHPRAGRV